ncbi:MAG: hypothetical protein JWO67_1499 [Streptosporangiaceae bacterium]|nr:hypothetical protein [Streptosporangiaceae bacterium]
MPRLDPSDRGKPSPYDVVEEAESLLLPLAVEQRVSQLRAALLGAADLDSIPDPVPLIDGMLFLDSLAWIYGKPGCAKTFAALSFAGHISTGTAWCSRPTHGGRVLYLVAEGVSGIKKRVRAWETDTGLSMVDVDFLPVAVQLLNAIDRGALVAIVAELRPALVVIDTQARVTVGMEENSNGEMGVLIDAAEKLREASGACVLIVHHAGKDGKLRGASAIEGAATTIIRAERDGSRVTLHSDKEKDVVDFPDVHLEMIPVADSVVLHLSAVGGRPVSLTPNEAAVVAALEGALEGALTKAEIQRATGLSESSFYKARDALVNTGKVRQQGRQKSALYVLTGR